MNWCDERYVRAYTRDTADFLALSFEAQGLLMLVLRKLDRSGVLELGRHGKRGVAIAVGHASRWDVLAPALEELLVDGCLVLDGNRLVMPNFVEAQEAVMSDRARQAESRARRRELRESVDASRCDSAESGVAGNTRVTERDAESRNVTESHAVSRDVTRGHAVSRDVTPSVPSVPSLPSVSLSPPPAARFDFEALYRPYPCKEGKRLGMRTLERTVKTQAQFDSFAAALRGYLERERAKGTAPKFHKHWSTFVNQWAGIAEELEDAKATPPVAQASLQSIPSNWAEVFTLAKREQALLAEGKTPPWWSLPRRWNMTTDLSGEQLIPVRDGRAVTDAA